MTGVPDVTCDVRTVTPRKETHKTYRIVALSNGEALLEDGTRTDEQSIIRGLDTAPATVVVSRNAAGFVERATAYHRDNPRWNWQVSSSERDIVRPNGQRLATRVSVVVHWFGFRGVNRHTPGVRHLTLDPIAFYGRKLDDVIPCRCGNKPCDCMLDRLMQWARSLYGWSQAAGIDLRPTSGSMASQFLRDRRFYPDNRRKVPAVINARVREALPGNFYKLYQGDDVTHREYQAVYLDQRRAHHYHARTTRFPHADSLTARGRYLTLDGDPRIPISVTGSDGFTGLYYAVFTVPTTQVQWGPFPDHQPGETYSGFVYSNEVSILTDLGYTFHGAIASWGSYKVDQGLTRYATWAEEQLNLYGDPKWLKPLLLSTYGVLATRPKPVRYMYHRATKGEAATVHTGHGELHGLLVESMNGRKLEPGFANVMHRGMIEAATRAESLGLAHYLHHRGCTILSIYADAVLVEDDGTLDLPFIPEPWRQQQTLTHLQFINTQAFVSAQVDKLPGSISRDILKVGLNHVGQAPKRRKSLYMAITGERVINGNAERKYLNA